MRSTTANDALITKNETYPPSGRLVTQGYWIACLIFNSFLIACQMFIIGRFMLYLFRKSRLRSRSKEGNILMAAGFAVVMPLSRFAGSLSVLMVGLDKKNDIGCEVAIDFSKFTFVVTMIFVDGFFWMRQRAFYSHPSLGMTFGKCVGILSKASICLILLLLTSMIPISVFPLEYEASELGCVFRNGEKMYGFRNYIYFGNMLTCQFIVLGLFLHPLWIHRKSQQRLMPHSNATTISKCSDYSTTATDVEASRSYYDETTAGNQTDSGQSSTQGVTNSNIEQPKKVSNLRKKKMKQRGRILALIKRTLILALVVVATDLIVVIAVTSLLPAHTPQIITRAVYDADLFINGATVILSFENWMEIIFPFIRASESKSENET